MALDPRYITSSVLEHPFVQKDTGEPLTGGLIYFWEDAARTTPKLVYELTDEPPYLLADSYSPLPNPMTLSMVGTPMDAAGNNIAFYYYPYDAAGNLQLYFVQVFDQFGVEQFTREAWPNQAIEDTNPDNIGLAGIVTNMLTNPQFATVLFSPTMPLVIPVAGAGTLNVHIAPGWFLNITSSGAGNVTLTQNAIAGISAYPSNPPYTLTIAPGANITGLSLTQKLSNNPDIWSPQNAASQNGFITGSILLAPMSSVTMQYAPSTGPAQIIVAANNLGAVYQEFNATIQLAPATNPSAPSAGFVNINIILPTVNPTTIGNIQVAGLGTEIENVVFQQIPVNREIDQMFNFWNPQLQLKPILSYLIGWDFPLNPAQFLTSTVAAIASGNNTSNYIWDQTIVFQTITSGVSYSRHASGGFQVTTASNGVQFALIQYLDAQSVQDILENRLSVNVSGTNSLGSIPMCISLWRCTDGALPNMAANTSLVATLSATGKPATLNGTWIEIPRSGPGSTTGTASLLGDAIFSNVASVTQQFTDNGFSGWADQLGTDINASNFFAIVVGTAPLAIGISMIFGSISLVPGDIPTRPAPLSADQVYIQCARYWNSSFAPGTLPANAVGAGTGAIAFNSTRVGANPQHAGNWVYPSPMREIANLVFYNPVNNNSNVYDTQVPGDCSAGLSLYNNKKSFNAACVSGNAGTIVGDILIIHYTADARLGIV